MGIERTGASASESNAGWLVSVSCPCFADEDLCGA